MKYRSWKMFMSIFYHNMTCSPVLLMGLKFLSTESPAQGSDCVVRISLYGHQSSNWGMYSKAKSCGILINIHHVEKTVDLICISGVKCTLIHKNKYTFWACDRWAIRYRYLITSIYGARFKQFTKKKCWCWSRSKYVQTNVRI